MTDRNALVLVGGSLTEMASTDTILGNISGNAATVTTNADLTGVITSSGNATSIASQTGTGTKFVVDTSPTLITPNIGAAIATSLNVGTPDVMVINGATITADVQVNSDILAIEEIHTHNDTAGAGGVMYMARSRGSNASPTVVQNGDTLGIISAVGYDGTDYAIGATLTFSVDGTPGNNDMPTKVVLAVTADGAATPTTALTVASTGAATFASTVAASNLSGTNTGDQTITLTGDVTGTGTGTFAATIAADSVTYDKMQDTSGTDVILGRSTAGAGTVEEIACTAAGRAILDDADAAAQRVTLGVSIVGGNLFIASPADGDIILVPYALTAGTINQVFALATSSGTLTATFNINGTPITGLSSLSVTSTPQSPSASAANTYSIGDEISLTIASSSSPANLQVTMKATV